MAGQMLTLPGGGQVRYPMGAGASPTPTKAPGGTQPLKLPNGKTVQIPAEWDEQQTQEWLDSQPHLQSQWQKDFNAGVDKYLPIPIVKDLIKGTVDTVAHPIENAPAVGGMIGGALSAPLVPFTGGASMPIGAGIGAALGHGVRDLVRHAEDDPRASKSVGGEAVDALGAGALEGALSAVIPAAGKVLGKVATPLRNSAVSTYTKALGVTPAMVEKMPVSLTPSGARLTLADKALKIGEAGLDRGIKVNPKGFADLQGRMDKMGAIKDYWLNQSKAEFEPATELLDPATNPVLSDVRRKFLRTLTPQDADAAMLKMEEAVKTSPNLMTPLGTPRRIDAKTMHELASNSASTLGDVFGDTKSVGKELSKAVNKGAMDLLKQRVSDVAAPMEEQFVLDKIRKSMENTMVHGEVAKDAIPGAYLALTHPLIAGASMAMKDPVMRTRMLSASAFHRQAASEGAANLAKKLAKDGWKYNLGRQGLQTAATADSAQSDKDILDALYEKWLAGK